MVLRVGCGTERGSGVPVVPADGARELSDGVLVVQVERRHRRP